MELAELAAQVDGFARLPPREKLRVFAWWLHAHKGVELFGADAIRECYKAVHLPPDQVAKYLGRMVENGDLVKERGGLKLGHAIRTQFDTKYGDHQSVIQVRAMLADLPAKVPDLAEQVFLQEALRCYRAQAFRACIVMTWNLAFDHLRNWLLKDAARLASFNAAIVKRSPKKANLPIKTVDDFDEFTEREVVDICNIAGVYSSNVNKILLAKLDRRNMAAHPSNIVVLQAQADDVVTDLINNVVLTLT